jgi:hypothetical protein
MNGLGGGGSQGGSDLRSRVTSLQSDTPDVQGELALGMPKYVVATKGLDGGMARMEDLFRQGDLNEFLDDCKRWLAKEVADISPSTILAASEADLCSELTRRYALDVPKLDRDGIQQEVPEEVSMGGSRGPLGRHAKATRIAVVVPFTGDPRLFRQQPSRVRGAALRARVSQSELHLVYQTTGHDSGELRREISTDLANIEWYLEGVAELVGRYNQSIPGIASSRIAERRREALRHKGLVEGLGIPIRRRENAPATYALPVTRRRPAIEAVPVSKEPFAPEPCLEMAEYEQILKIIQNMAVVMERSPSAFEHMEEEDLRVHFLVQLNGQYEGEAMGEVFNLAGKTDILVRHEGRNVFIAECKFWDGPESLHDAIGQLLSYAAWRDTKTAIILFSRRKGFSAVLEQIPGVLRQHPAYKRDDAPQGETIFRYVLGRPDDMSRELILTICTFDVPSTGVARQTEGQAQN